MPPKILILSKSIILNVPNNFKFIWLQIKFIDLKIRYYKKSKALKTLTLKYYTDF